MDDDFLLHLFGRYKQENNNDFPANPPGRRNHRASDYADDETDGAAADGAAADAEGLTNDMQSQKKPQLCSIEKQGTPQSTHVTF